MAIPRLDPVPAGAPRPRVSVVMPTYKRPHLIRETLLTVVNQTFPGMEILVKADGTEDGTEAEVRHVGDPRIRFSRSPVRLGMPGILNSVVAETRGELVLILHDHDLYHPRLAGELVRRLDAHPAALYAHAAVQIVDGNGRVTRSYLNAFPEVTPGPEWARFMLSRFDCPVCACSMVRRDALERHGLFDPEYGFLADIELWLRLSMQGDVAYVPEILMSLREREAGHEYKKIKWDAVDSVVRIHRRYTPAVLPGWRSAAWLALRTERLLIESYLASMKQTRFARAARREGKEFLRRVGGPLSHLVAAVL